MPDFESCHKCTTKRYVGCHSTCPDYLKEKRIHDAKMEARRKSRQDVSISGYDFDRNLILKFRSKKGK